MISFPAGWESGQDMTEISGNLHHRRAWQRVLREIAGLRAGASPAPESRKVAWNWKRGKKVEP